MKTILLILFLFNTENTTVRIEPQAGQYSCQSAAEGELAVAHGMALCFDTDTNQVTYLQSRE